MKVDPSDSSADPGPLVKDTHSPWPARIGWGLFGVAYLAFAVVTVATIQSGLHGDPERTNPNPGPAPYPPFLGFDNWPIAVAISSIPMAIGLIAALSWLSWRQRKIHWAVIIAFAGLITGALDPLANWATFAIFDPRMLHFPSRGHTSTFRRTSSLRWRSSGICRLLPSQRAGLSAIARPPRRPTFAALELVRPSPAGRGLHRCDHRRDPDQRPHPVRVDAGGHIFYTEAVGPVLQIGHIHFPVIMAVYDSIIFGMVAVMCVRDENGDLVLINRIARWLPARAGRPKVTLTRQLLISVAVGLVSFATPLAVLAGLREAGLSRPAYDQNPYPNVKVYDPYGHLEEAGKPGPFFR